MSDALPTEEELKRRAVFVPCQTKEDLSRWIRVYLGLHIPDCIVSGESNSSPMDMIWEIYDICKRGETLELEQFNRMMAYASRDSFKTLSAAIIEVLMLVHLDRPVVHLAAILQQSKKAQEYVKDFFRKPYLNDFVEKQNEREIEYVRYYNPETGFSIPLREWAALPPDKQTQWERKYNYVRIIVATLQSTNAQHVPFMCVDGNTKIFVKNDKSIKQKNRTRTANTARGIFNRIAGLPLGGNPKKCDQSDLDIPKPFEEIQVLSYNFDTGSREFKKILRGHRQTSECVEVGFGSGSMTCSTDHRVCVIGRGFIPANELKVGDKLLQLGKMRGMGKSYKNKKFTKSNSTYTQNQQQMFDYDLWEQVLVGTLLGDACLCKKPTNNAYLMFQHCKNQGEYARWKASILSRKIRIRERTATSGYTGKPLVGFSSGNSPLLNKYINIRNDLNFLNLVEAPALAVWYMDDGCAGNGFRLSTENWSQADNQTISNFLFKKFQIKTQVHEYSRDNKTYYYLRGGIEAKRRLVELCEQFFHPSMAYKLDTSKNTSDCVVCGQQYWFFESGNTSNTCSSYICRDVGNGLNVVDVKYVKHVGKRTVYDFTIADNHNFFGNRILQKNCVDEADIIANPKAYEEAKMIPAPWHGKLPITLLTSTRKFSYGLVQQELDEAPETGLIVRHWNIIDVTEPCPADRHKPELPMVDMYVNESQLTHIGTSEYELLDSEAQKKYELKRGYAGCATCPLFSKGCGGRLASEQKSKSPLLKPIPHTINLFRAVSADAAQAQLLCRKPESEGLIFPRLNPDLHMKTPQQIAEIVTGEECSHVNDKTALINLLIQKGAKFYAGMDFGFTHNFAVTSVAVFGQFAFIFDVISQSGLELDDKLVVSQKLKMWDPIIFGDPESPADIKTFKRKGFRMKEWDKYAGSVKAGIEVVRMKIQPALGEPQMFFLKDDPGCELLFQRMSKYHFTTDTAGNISDVPSDEDDDEIDSIRYAIMNIFSPKGKITMDPTPQLNKPLLQPVADNPNNTWLSSEIKKRIGSDESDSDTPSITVKKGRFFFDG